MDWYDAGLYYVSYTKSVTEVDKLIECRVIKPTAEERYYGAQVGSNNFVIPCEDFCKALDRVNDLVKLIEASANFERPEESEGIEGIGFF